MEYRLEMIQLSESEDRTAHLISRLNEFAKQGWRVVSIDLSTHPSFSAAPLPVLLERQQESTDSQSNETLK
jgi:hypothetical protein